MGKAVTGLTEGFGGDGLAGHAMKGAMAAVSGGLASVAGGGGGKFGDGAKTAAYGYLFNQVQSALRYAFSSSLTNPNGDVAYRIESSVRGLSRELSRYVGIPTSGASMAAYLDDQSQKFAYGGLAVSAIPLLAPSAPAFFAISEATGLGAQVLNPRPVMLFSDELVDATSKRLPIPMQNPVSQFAKDIKNSTPIGGF